jgi:hypothetical protein
MEKLLKTFNGTGKIMTQLQQEFETLTLKFAKITSFLVGFGLTQDQLRLMIDDFSILQCQELGENLNVFEYLDFGIIDEPGECDHGELYVSRTLTSEVIYDEELSEKLVRYPDEEPTVPFQPRWVEISEIVVPSEFDKEQLLLGFKYFHDLRVIDTNIMAVSTIAHMYEVPDRITVKSDT